MLCLCTFWYYKEWPSNSISFFIEMKTTSILLTWVLLANHDPLMAAMPEKTGCASYQIWIWRDARKRARVGWLCGMSSILGTPKTGIFGTALEPQSIFIVVYVILLLHSHLILYHHHHLYHHQPRATIYIYIPNIPHQNRPTHLHPRPYLLSVHVVW